MPTSGAFCAGSVIDSSDCADLNFAIQPGSYETCCSDLTFGALLASEILDVLDFGCYTCSGKNIVAICTMFCHSSTCICVCTL